jgi:hypothetical protein
MRRSDAPPRGRAQTPADGSLGRFRRDCGGHAGLHAVWPAWLAGLSRTRSEARTDPPVPRGPAGPQRARAHGGGDSEIQAGERIAHQPAAAPAVRPPPPAHSPPYRDFFLPSGLSGPPSCCWRAGAAGGRDLRGYASFQEAVAYARSHGRIFLNKII